MRHAPGLDEVATDVALSLEQVSARYPATDYLAIDRVSLRVDTSEITAVLGPNGSGKSTLLRLAAGILEANEGRVRIFGRNVRKIDRKVLARQMAFVPQTENLATGFRVRDVVAMGRAPHQGGWMRERSEDHAPIDEALARCDLSGLALRRVEELSGGEQRRVALARALAQRPRVLLLDEPGAFLDVRHRLELYALLHDVAVRDRVACVVAMHELDAAALVGTRVLLLKGGRVVAEGTPGAVLTPEVLREVFDAQIDVSVHEPSGRRYFIIRRES